MGVYITTGPVEHCDGCGCELPRVRPLSRFCDESCQAAFRERLAATVAGRAGSQL